MAFDPAGSGANKTQAEALGVPIGYKAYTPFPFGSIDQMASRIGMADQDFFWLENLMVSGPGKIISLDDHGTAIYTAPEGKTIISFFWFNIETVAYVAVFLSDGTAVQVRESDGGETAISSTAGTFYTSATDPLPACAQSGSQYLVISTNITQNSYWIWDGAVLYAAGGLSPEVTLRAGGNGYSSTPTITIFGGHGTGAAATATIANGSVIDVNITSPGTGYVPTDTVQLIFLAGGSDTAARLTAVLTSTTVDHIALIDGGSGYTSTPNVNISGGGGSGATATASISDGKVTAITLTAAGSSYEDSPTVTITDGGGSGAKAYALLVATTLASVTITAGGTGYTGTPTVTVVGGGGSGATVTTTTAGGAINTAPVGAAGSGYTSAPAIVIDAGFNDAAYADAALMPFGVSGAAIEIFSNRVWIAFPNQGTAQNNAGTFQVSAPNSLTDFASADGGSIFVNTDRFLRQKYTALRQSNGFLYPLGDSSVSVISNVQTSASAVTTFNYQNTDPQVGTPWRDTVADYGRSILFANSLGVYGIYGGAATKISGKMDDVFDTFIEPADGGVTPSSATISISGQKCYLLLMTILDPLTEETRNAMIAFNEKDWFVLSQSVDLTYIGSQEVNSVLYAWGTDGTSLYPLATEPSDSLTKTLATKAYGAATMFVVKQALMVYMQAQNHVADTTATFEVTVDIEGGSYPLRVNPFFPGVFAPNPDLYAGGAANVAGTTLGLTVTTTAPDFEINHLVIGYTEALGLFGMMGDSSGS